MRIPLIVSSRPSEEINFPRVILPSGRWKFTSDHSDSELCVKTSTGSVELHEELILKEKTPVSLVCKKRGTESSITVYVCLCL